MEANGATRDVEGWPAARAAVLTIVGEAAFGRWQEPAIAEALYLANLETAEGTARDVIAEHGFWSMVVADTTVTVRGIRES